MGSMEGNTSIKNMLEMPSYNPRCVCQCMYIHPTVVVVYKRYIALATHLFFSNPPHGAFRMAMLHYIAKDDEGSL